MSVPVPAAAPAAPNARDRAVILVLLIATFVVILNETVLNVALPRLMTELHVSAGTVQWLATAFLLTMAVVIPVTGFLLQRFPSRAVFFGAMGLFSAGTLLAALAPGFEVLLLARIVQATGTAIMFPLLTTTVLTLVPPAGRGAVMGNISIVISVAPAIGPTVSGLILQAFSWRALFLFVLPVALAALAYGARTLTNVGEPRRLALDLPSVPLSAVGFGGLVYGLSRAGESAGGLANPEVWGSLLASVLALGLFVARQISLQRGAEPFLDLRAFRVPAFALGVSLMMIAMLALFGGAILLPISLQNVRGLSSLQTGLLLLPGGLVMGLLAPGVGRLFDRFGPVWLATPGAALITLSLALMAGVTAATPVPMLLALHLAFSVGLALLFTPVFTSALGPLPPRLYSHGSAILGTLQQVAGAAGTALLVTIMTARSAALAGRLPPREALAAGLHTAFLVAAAVGVLAVVLALFTRRAPGTPHGDHDAPGGAPSGDPHPAPAD